MFVVEPKVRGLWWHGQVTVLAVKNEESVVVGSYTWVAADPVVSGAWCLKSTEKKDHMDECPVIIADFKPVALPGAQSTMVSGVRSWQMVGSAPVEEVRTNVTKEDQTDINGPKATPTDVALADVKAGLLAGSRSSVSAAEAASPSAKKANKPKECEEDDGINFFDSVSQSSWCFGVGWIQGTPRRAGRCLIKQQLKIKYTMLKINDFPGSQKTMCHVTMSACWHDL